MADLNERIEYEEPARAIIQHSVADNTLTVSLLGPGLGRHHRYRTLCDENAVPIDLSREIRSENEAMVMQRYYADVSRKFQEFFA